MRMGIRAKLVALLLFVAVLPLLAALATIMIGGRRLRSEAFGQTIQTVAESQASSLAEALAKDIDKFRLAFQRDSDLRAVLAADRPQLSDSQLAELDRIWPTLTRQDRQMRDVLATPTSARLRELQVEDERLAEVLIADRFGQLVAATGRTSDYYQGDERWWLEAYGDGITGKLYVPQVGYDQSTMTWSIDICIPIRSGRSVVGVAKVVLDVSRWLGRTRTAIGEIPTEMLLVRYGGTIVTGRQVEPMSETIEQWSGPIASSGSGWRVTDSGAIQGFAPVHVGEKVGTDVLAGPTWTVVFSASQGDVTGMVGTLGFSALIIGLLIIGSLFVLGLVLVERSVVRRLHGLARAARRVTEGDLAHRVADVRPGKPLLDYDEIDDLVRDFNRMIERVQRSHAELEAGNEMKTNFIRVASHELRTPISYILATVKLLRDSTDRDRMRHAMQSMGAKAKRLEQIITAMFKLIPTGDYGEALHYTRISTVELLEEVYLDCFPFIEQRRQQLIIEDAPAVGEIRADREKLRDVLENLVMNAIKFTPDGGVIRLSVVEELGGYTSFSVHDQGPGIDAADVPHVFDAFFSGGDVMKHSSGSAGFQKRGMGLGLAIVKHFAELHGGTVRVTSDDDGTIFSVQVPTEGLDRAPGGDHQQAEAEAKVEAKNPAGDQTD